MQLNPERVETSNERLLGNVLKEFSCFSKSSLMSTSSFALFHRIAHYHLTQSRSSAKIAKYNKEVSSRTEVFSLLH